LGLPSKNVIKDEDLRVMIEGFRGKTMLKVGWR
jgi:hypothetical protein